MTNYTIDTVLIGPGKLRAGTVRECTKHSSVKRTFIAKKNRKKFEIAAVHSRRPALSASSPRVDVGSRMRIPQHVRESHVDLKRRSKKWTPLLDLVAKRPDSGLLVFGFPNNLRAVARHANWLEIGNSAGVETHGLLGFRLVEDLTQKVVGLLEQLVDLVTLTLEILDVEVDVISDGLQPAAKLDEAPLEGLALEAIASASATPCLGCERPEVTGESAANMENPAGPGARGMRGVGHGCQPGSTESWSARYGKRGPATRKQLRV